MGTRFDVANLFPFLQIVLALSFLSGIVLMSGRGKAPDSLEVESQVKAGFQAVGLSKDENSNVTQKEFIQFVKSMFGDR